MLNDRTERDCIEAEWAGNMIFDAVKDNSKYTHSTSWRRLKETFEQSMVIKQLKARDRFSMNKFIRMQLKVMR